MPAQTATKPQPDLKPVPKSPARERLAELVKLRDGALRVYGLAQAAAHRAQANLAAAEERLEAAKLATDEAKTAAAARTATAMIGGGEAPNNNDVAFARADEDVAADQVEIAIAALETVEAQVEPARVEVSYCEKDVAAAIDAVLGDPALLKTLFERAMAVEASLIPLRAALKWVLAADVCQDRALGIEVWKFLHGRGEHFRGLPMAPPYWMRETGDARVQSSHEQIDWYTQPEMTVWDAVRKQLGEDPFCPLPFPIV